MPPSHSVISWSISNPSIATLGSTNGISTTLTKVGSGTVTLTATLQNSCNQTTTISTVINVGAPILPESATVTGATYSGFSQTQYYTLNGDSTNGGTSYQWSVDGPMNDSGGPTCAWQILSGQGTKTIKLLSGSIAAQVVIRVVATSSCGSSNTKYIYVTVSNNSCPPALRLSKNPVPNGDFTANVIYPPKPCDTQNAKVSTTINNDIKIYDFSGNVVYTDKQNSDELTFNNLQLKKGIYILQVITESGTVIKDKIIIE